MENSRPAAESNAISSLKVPPHSLEAEQAVLGGLMLDNSVWDTVSEIVMEEDFYRHEHQLIFRVMYAQTEADKPIDVVTLVEALDSLGEVDSAGGLDYLSDLAANARGSANISAYADIIAERSKLRKLIKVAYEIAESGYTPAGQRADDVLDVAEQKVFKIADDRPKDGGPQEINPLLKSAVKRIDELFKSKGGLTGLPTGYKDLDEKTSGLQKSDLIIVAGRPSMGKTSFAMNLAENALLLASKPVLVFSLEMPAESLIFRMISSIGRIDQKRLRDGKLEEEDWPKLTAAVSKLKDKPLFIDDSVGLSPMEMRSRARRIVREHGDLGLIVVDYLQLMQIKGFGDNRVGEISEISRSLKTMAREFECPVIALSQLNRSLEQRPNKRPVMSDLRESGAIEQDADIIAFVYRDEVYNEDTDEKGVAEVIIGKQRNGPIGTVKLSFLGQYTRFETLARPDYDESYTHGG
ncbi:MAG: replicative DNA helicase [Pseudohongiellaceae bacterium]|nr:replicative DNA helicase [Pseudohongiellaceae bacterium]